MAKAGDWRIEMKHVLDKDDVLSDVRYYTYSEVAKILRCSERTVHNRVRSGDIIPFRNGRLVLFTQECIDDFLKRKIS